MSDGTIDRLNAALTGRYRIDGELGAGGMATVYLAHDVKHERRVALKVLKPELAAVVGADRFLAEIKTTANLHHPHILPLFDSGEADGFLFYVMPYVEGETLRERLDRERQLPVAEAVGIATAVANALQHAHERGVIHRDIKPGNILMQDGQPVVGDFGIALAVGSAGGARLTETGLSVGTPYYMSPEQATGDVMVGPASDTYALAAVLYEMLTGDPPYSGSTAQAVLGKIIQGGPVSVTAARASVPANVDAAIRKGLEKLPADRFADARDFARALADPSFRHGAPAHAGVSADGRPWKRAALAFAASTLLLALATGWLATRPEPPLPVTRYAMLVPDELPLLAQFGGQVALSPDGGAIAFVSAEEGGPALYLLERDRLEARRLDGTEGAWQPFFSPDGTRVGFITGDRQLRIISLGGEPPLTVVDSGVVRGGASWGDDGFIYFAEGSSNASVVAGLGRVPGTGGPIESVTTLDSTRDEMVHFFPEVLPGGRAALFTLARDRLYDSETMEIAVADFETGEHRTLLQGMLARWSTTGHILVVRDDGALLAAPFDEGRLELTGPAVPIMDGIALEALAGNQASPSSAEVAISRNGTLVYAAGAEMVGGGQWAPVWVTREGAVQEIDPDMRRGDFHFPELSPDGGRLALTVGEAGEYQVWVKQLERGPLSKLTFQGAFNSRASWAPDGSTIAFVSNSDDDRDAYARRADGSGQRELLVDEDAFVNEILYSPDGSWLVYRRDEDLFARRVGSGSEEEPRVLLDTEYLERAPVISPDGRWIAYQSDESGTTEVYVRPFPNTQDARWLISTDGGVAPRWAHSGRELFYASTSDVVLMAVPVVDDPTTFVAGQPRGLFPLSGFRLSGQHAPYDVAPGDDRFLLLQGVQAGGQLVVVENFTRELLERVGR